MKRHFDSSNLLSFNSVSYLENNRTDVGEGAIYYYFIICITHFKTYKLCVIIEGYSVLWANMINLPDAFKYIKTESRESRSSWEEEPSINQGDA